MIGCWWLIAAMSSTLSPAPVVREYGPLWSQQRCEAALSNARTYAHVVGSQGDLHLPHPEDARQLICICRERAR